MRLVLCLVLLGALAAPASAATPTVFGHGHGPGVAIDAAGTAHVAYNGNLPSTSSSPLMYCAWPRGAKTCAPRAIVNDQESPLGQPALLQAGPGSAVTIVSSRQDIDVFNSADGGANWAGPTPIGEGRWFDGAFGPGGQLALTFRNLGYVEFYERNLAGPADNVATANLNNGFAINSVAGFSGAVPVVVSGASRPGIASSVWTGQGDVHDPLTWAGPYRIAHANNFQLASGPRGLWLAHDTSPTDSDRVIARLFHGRRFGNAHRIPVGRLGTDDIIGLGFGQASNGEMVVVWYVSVENRLEVSASKTGRRWTTARVLATGVTLPGQIEVGLGPDGRGLVVWDDNGDDLMKAVKVSAPALLR